MMGSLENVANYGNPEESLAIPANREKPRGMYYTDSWVMGGAFTHSPGATISSQSALAYLRDLGSANNRITLQALQTQETL